MWTVLAAKNQGDPVIGTIAVLISLVVGVVYLLHEATASYDLNTRGGLPFCPRCNRQVSWRREHCRACGYVFKTYGPKPKSKAQREAEEAEAEDERRRARRYADQIRDERAERARVRKEERAERARVRDEHYRSLGVKPGRLAWYRVQPDWCQAIILGVAFAAPAVVILAVLFTITGR